MRKKAMRWILITIIHAIAGVLTWAVHRKYGKDDDD